MVTTLYHSKPQLTERRLKRLSHWVRVENRLPSSEFDAARIDAILEIYQQLIEAVASDTTEF